MLSSNRTGVDRRKLAASATIAAILLILSFLFPINGDDWCYEGGIDLLNFKYIFGSIADNWQNLNGRVLGNLLSLIAGKSDVLKDMLRAAVIFGIILLVNKNAGMKTVCGLLIAFIYALSLPKSIFRQTYAWASGFYDYVMPALLILLYLLLIRGLFTGGRLIVSAGRTAACAAIGVCAQLFIENLTLYNLALGAVLFFWHLIRNKKFSPALFAFMLGSAAGAAIMFTSPVYGQVAAGTDWYRTMATSYGDILFRIEKMAPHWFKYLISENYALIFSIALLCLYILYAYGPCDKKWKSALKFAAIAAMSLLPAYFVIPEKILWVETLMCALFFVSAAVTILFFVRDNTRKLMALLFLISAPAAAAPLIIVTPVGPRCFYASYIFLVSAVINLLAYVTEGKKPDFKLIRLPLIMLAVCVSSFYIFIYARIAYVQNLGEKYIEHQMSVGATTIELPAYPYTDYIHDTSTSKVGEYYYYNKKNDIQFKYVNYTTWLYSYYYKNWA